MKRRVCLLLIGSSPLAFTQARKLTVESFDGGSVITPLGSGIAVNAGSTLNRRWFTINDSTCPIQLPRLGVVPKFKIDRYSGSYTFAATGNISAMEELRAFRILFVQFNIWGERMRNLSLNRVADARKQSGVEVGGEWYANEADVSEYFTCVSMVDQAMLGNGQIWSADHKAISNKLSEISLRVTEAGLVPDPPKAPPQQR